MSTTKRRRVYLIQHGDRYKIGNSKNPHARLWQVVPTDATDARVLHSFLSANAYEVERALHRRFKHCRLGGEWFSLTADEVAMLCRLPQTDTIEDLPLSLRPSRWFVIKIKKSSSQAAASRTRTAASKQPGGVILGADVEAALAATMPTKGRNWRLAMKMYVVRLRAIPRLADGNPRDLLHLAHAWYEHAGLLFRVKENDVNRCFVNEWRRAKYPHAKGPLEVYLPGARAMQAPAVLPPGKRNAALRLLANLSALLQDRAGAGQTWFLSQRSAGELLGITQTAAGLLLVKLINLGLLTRTTVGSHLEGKASEYVWIGPPVAKAAVS